MTNTVRTSKKVYEEILEANKEALCLRAAEIEKENDIDYAINAVTMAIITNRMRPAADKIGKYLVLRNARLLERVPLESQFRRVRNDKRLCWVYISLTAKAYNCKNIEELIDAVA
jgi:hypothetical protein